MTVEQLDERLEALERQVDDLRRALQEAVLAGNRKVHVVDRVYGAMKHPEWDDVIRLGQEARNEDRVPDDEP